MQKSWRWKEVGLGLLNLLAIVLVILILQPLFRKYLPGSGAAVMSLIVFFTYLAGVKWIERRKAVEFAPARAVPEVATGAGLGFLLFAAVMGVLFAVGVYHPSGWGTGAQLAHGLFLAVLAGVMEEILFRGLLFRLSARVVGTWGALLFTSALFGLAHAANPGATFSSSAAIALEAGTLLGAAYAATQRLWLPIALHIGWNFTEGSIFSMSVSGTGTREGLLRGSLSGPRLLTGGAFGPEASLVAVILCLAVAIFFLWRTVKLGRVEPPIWSLRATERNPAAIPTLG
jgi:membrane protease YdiL (CAAX protease family)